MDYKFTRKESYEHRKGIKKDPFIELAGKKQRDARRDKNILMFISFAGLVLTLFGRNEAIKYSGVWIMFISSIISFNLKICA